MQHTDKFYESVHSLEIVRSVFPARWLHPSLCPYNHGLSQRSLRKSLARPLWPDSLGVEVARVYSIRFLSFGRNKTIGIQKSGCYQRRWRITRKNRSSLWDNQKRCRVHCMLNISMETISSPPIRFIRPSSSRGWSVERRRGKVEKFSFPDSEKVNVICFRASTRLKPPPGGGEAEGVLTSFNFGISNHMRPETHADLGKGMLYPLSLNFEICG